jgi:hypothetical protein
MNVEHLLSAFPEDARDRLVPLLKSGPVIFERLTGQRPHRSKVQRCENPGVRGVRLQVVRVGNERFTTPRAVCEFLLAAGGAAKPQKKAARAPSRARARAGATDANGRNRDE